MSLPDSSVDIPFDVIKFFVDNNALDDETLFQEACKHGSLTFIKEALSGNENKAINLEGGLINAAKFGHVEVLKYLLTSEDIKKHPSIDANNDEPFIAACEQNQAESLRYLIFDMNLNKSSHIEEYLRLNPHEDAIKFFGLRELNDRLSSDFSFKDDTRDKKIKL